jgi:hypothetical protein
VAKNILTDTVSVPLDGTETAKVEINAGTGNLMIDGLVGGEQAQVLASGTLQYYEKGGVPTRSLDSMNGQSTLSVRGEGGRQGWLRLPWVACNGEFDWQIHLNPTVPSDVTAHSGGGNVKLDLAGMAVRHLTVDTAGGNLDVVLPDNASDLHVLANTGGGNVTVDVGKGIRGTKAVEARSGAGNVAVRLPRGTPALIHAHSGMGNVVVDPGFGRTDKETYRSPDYDTAQNKVEITAASGAGNVTISTK